MLRELDKQEKELYNHYYKWIIPHTWSNLEKALRIQRTHVSDSFNEFADSQNCFTSLLAGFERMKSEVLAYAKENQV